jgi:7,8-dihydroneopterin aldolase/epimerase/oxygenase
MSVHNLQPFPASDIQRTMRVFVRDLVLQAQIGVFDHEQGRTQAIRISLEVEVDLTPPTADSLSEVVCYQDLVDGVRDLVDSGHVKLVETLADRILDLAFAHSAVWSAHVVVEKLSAISQAASVGVEMTRVRTGFPTR